MLGIVWNHLLGSRLLPLNLDRLPERNDPTAKTETTRCKRWFPKQPARENREATIIPVGCKSVKDVVVNLEMWNPANSSSYATLFFLGQRHCRLRFGLCGCNSWDGLIRFVCFPVFHSISPSGKRFFGRPWTPKIFSPACCRS